MRDTRRSKARNNFAKDQPCQRRSLGARDRTSKHLPRLAAQARRSRRPIHLATTTTSVDDLHVDRIELVVSSSLGDLEGDAAVANAGVCVQPSLFHLVGVNEYVLPPCSASGANRRRRGCGILNFASAAEPPRTMRLTLRSKVRSRRARLAALSAPRNSSPATRVSTSRTFFEGYLLTEGQGNINHLGTTVLLLPPRKSC
jgi:hypothetical protein